MKTSAGNIVESPERSRWWIFIALVLILNIPNFLPWERGLYPATYWLDMQERLFKCILLATIFVSLFDRPRVSWLVSWVLCLWWLPISVATRYVSGTQINSNLMGIALASSPGELQNLALSIPIGITVGLIAWNICCAIIYSWLKSIKSSRWNRGIRIRLMMYSSALLAVPLIAQSRNNLPDDFFSEARHSISVDPFAEGDRVIGKDADLPRAFPYELPWAAAQYWRARSVVRASIEKMHDNPSEDASLSLRRDAPDVIVLVIGESSSRNTWHLFNPKEASTTPRLDARIRGSMAIFPFTNVVAQTIATRQAVPSMLTREPLLWPDGKPNSGATRSVISLASKAGYKTAWFSNQAAIGEFDGVIAAYAHEADVKAFLNPSNFRLQGSLDEVLLAPMQQHLRKFPRSFIVLHTMGSHFRFDHRYPPEFGPFANSKNENESYRNSIAYTDFILDRVIDILETDRRPAVMIYTSDHGQGLPDDRCNKSIINRATSDSYEVPVVLWLSDSYAGENPEIAKLLQLHKSDPFTNGDVYQTLLDFLFQPPGVLKSEFNKNNISFINGSNGKLPRKVVSPGVQWIDYDAAVARDACTIRGQ